MKINLASLKINKMKKIIFRDCTDIWAKADQAAIEKTVIEAAETTEAKE